jgi:hypothetical protein
MIIDAPVVILPSTPMNRPIAAGRAGGGGTSVVTESTRPLRDPEQPEAGRRNDAWAGLEDRRGRSDAEFANRVRLEIARQGAIRQNPDWSVGSSDPPSADADRFLSAADVRQLRDRLESRLALDGAGATLRRLDEVG